MGSEMCIRDRLSAFTQYRAGSTQDTSFHAHLDKVGNWRNRLVASTNANLRAGLNGSGRRLRQLKAEAEWLSIVEKMITPRPKERIKMSFIMGSLGSGKVTGGRRRSMDGGGYSGQVSASLGLANAPTVALVDLEPITKPNIRTSPTRKPELSVFDGYFQQQSQKLEPTGGW